MTFDTPLILPSLLAADWSQVGAEVRRAEEAGAERLHLDVMDGQFVDNISFGPQMVEVVRKACDKLYLDVHLMIHRPDHYLPRFIAAGANSITVHVEARHDGSVEETLKAIKAAGLNCGLALHPDTPFEAAIPYLQYVDLLLIMTVVPGFGGQPFMEKETMPKLAAARDYRTANQMEYHLQVDGGIHLQSAPIAKANGANLFVCGTSAFGKGDMKAAMDGLKAAVADK